MAFFLVMAHGPLLQLPYYWDEAGQFIPAASDIYHSGALIPYSAIPNVHPPGVMAWLALAWRVAGYSIVTARVAMLLIAAFGLLVPFLLSIELSRGSTGTPAFITVTLLFLCPLFYAQSMLAQLDMPAMAFTALALLLFLQNRFRACALACAVLVLVKETGFVAPLVFGGWLLFERRAPGDNRRDVLWFLLPVGLLAIWLCALRHFTGFWFGNASFTKYNAVDTLDPVRVLFALVRRAYYLFIGSGHIIGTAIVWFAWKRMPILKDRPWRIALTLAAAQILTVSVLGGAVLERYLLPVLPILYSAFALAAGALSIGTRRVAIGALVVALIAANFVNPPYPFPFENNLMFVTFTDIAQQAAFAADRYNQPVTTTFPMTTALAHPRNGYLMLPHRTHEIPDFRPETIQPLVARPPALMIVYNTEFDPWGLRGTELFEWFFAKYYNYERPMSALEISQLLNMRIAREWESRGFSMALLVNDGLNGPVGRRFGAAAGLPAGADTRPYAASAERAALNRRMAASTYTTAAMAIAPPSP
ncbi:MAG TPA: hypothetical protein VHA14_03535 [Bryobacteraceae bacterium]|nr:hypothetical protein [Bryobacteraceae bacterium]